MEYEYGVVFKREPSVLHRGPWSLEASQAWIDEGIDDGFPQGLFFVVRREIGNWEPV